MSYNGMNININPTTKSVIDNYTKKESTNINKINTDIPSRGKTAGNLQTFNNDVETEIIDLSIDSTESLNSTENGFLLTEDEYDYVYNYTLTELNNEIDTYERIIADIQAYLNANSEWYETVNSRYNVITTNANIQYADCLEILCDSEDISIATELLKEYGLTEKTVINEERLMELLKAQNISDDDINKILESYTSPKTLLQNIQNCGLDYYDAKAIRDSSLYYYEEISNYYLENNEEIKGLCTVLAENNVITQEGKIFNSTYEFINYYQSLQSAASLLGINLYQAEQQKKLLEYTTYTLTEEYQKYNDSDYDIDAELVGECKSGWFNINYDYDEYCEKSGQTISPLQYMEYVLSKDPNASFKIDGYDVKELQLILQMSSYGVTADNTSIDIKKLFNFLYANKREETAQEFIGNLDNEFNKFKGELKAQEFLNHLVEENGNVTWEDIANHLLVGGKGLEDGIQSFLYGIVYFGEGYTTLGQLFETHIYNPEEYEAMYIMQALTSHNSKVESGLILVEENGTEVSNSKVIDYTKDYTKGLNLNYEISQSIGNMAPSMLVSLLNPLAGTVVMGTSAAGNSYHSALVSGASSVQARFYGICSGLSEAGLEYLLGGIPGLSKSDELVTSVSQLIKQAVSEGKEEFVQEYVDALFRYTILKEDVDIVEVTDNAVHSFTVGSITGGIMNTPSMIRGLNARRQVSKIVAQYNMPKSYVVQILESQGVIQPVDLSQIDVENSEQLNRLYSNKYKEIMNTNPELVLKILNETEYKVIDVEKIENIAGAKFADDSGYITKEVGSQLEKQFFSEDNVIGIHRAGLMEGSTIMKDGLILTGHTGNGGFSSDIDLPLNISFYDKSMYPSFLINLKGSYSYKTFDTGIADALIVSIPKSELIINPNDILDIKIKNNSNDLIDNTGVNPKLNSKYILGYITSDHGNIIKYVQNENYYQNTESNHKASSFDTKLNNTTKVDNINTDVIDAKTDTTNNQHISELEHQIDKKMEEYNRLIDIKNSEEYQFYQSEREKGHALSYNEEFHNLDSNMATLLTEINQLEAKQKTIGETTNKVGENNNNSAPVIDNSQSLAQLELELDKKMGEYNRLIDIKNSEEYRFYQSEREKGHALSYNEEFHNLDSNMATLLTEINQLEAKQKNIGEITNKVGENNNNSAPVIDNSQSLAQLELELDKKMEEYNRLIDIKNSEEYRFYQSEREKGHALSYNEEFHNLDSNMATLLTEINQLEVQHKNLDDSAITQKKVFAEYNGDLRRYIFENMPKDLDYLEAARYIYLKLNNEVSFSSKGFVGEFPPEIYYRKVDMSNYKGEGIVCSNWSNMYSELLTSLGIENYIRGGDTLGAHKWVVFKIDNKYYMADATQSFIDGNDIAKVQLGVETYGFVEIGYDQFISNNFANRAAKRSTPERNLLEICNQYTSKTLTNIDQKIGFDTKTLENLFSNDPYPGELSKLGLPLDAPPEKIIEKKLETYIFPKLEKMNVSEGLVAYNLMKHQELSNKELSQLSSKWLKNITTGELASLYSVDNGKTYLYTGKSSIKEVSAEMWDNYQDYNYIALK